MIRAAGMIICRGPRILAFRKFDESGLSIPCGKINLDEDTLAAAVREVREETGYVVEAADRPPFVAYDTYGGALVTTYLGHIVGGSLLELAGTEGIPSWASVREVARGPFWHYNCQALRHFGLAIPLAGKFHSHITLDSATKVKRPALPEEEPDLPGRPWEAQIQMHYAPAYSGLNEVEGS